MEQKFYVRIAEGLEDSGFLYPKEDFEKGLQDGFASENDQYSSVYLYNEEHYKQFQTTKSVRGIKNVVTDKIIFDFDSDSNPELARKDTLELVNRLKAKSVDPDNIDLYWSGKKGFTVTVRLDRTITPEVHEKIALDLFGKGLETLDRGVYNASRILRVPNTKHPKSNLYKVKLTYPQLQTLDVEKIKKLAVNPTDKIKLSKPVKFQEDVFIAPVVIKEKPKVTTNNKVNQLAPRHWKDYKWAILNAEGLKAGERHYAMMVIAATCRGLGYNQELTESFLKTFDAKYAENTKQGENQEEIDLTLNSVFSENWNGGQYSIEKNAWLRGYCDRMGFSGKEESKVIQLHDIEEEFIDYVKNIDKNTILTGIQELDEAVPLTVGMNLGLVGAASSGKCLGKDTPVMMFDGSIKKVQDIKVGELLMGDDSLPRTVLSTCTGREKMYKIEQDNGDSYIVNESHILSLRSNYNAPKNKNIRKGRVIDINVLEFMNSSGRMKRYYKGYKVPVNFARKEQVLDPYFIGLWLGDGSSAKPEITSMDREIQQYLQNYCINVDHSMNTYNDGKSRASAYSLSNKGKINTFRDELKKLNLFNNKHIPDIYLKGDREQRLKLLAGLIDSDGHWSSSNHYEITFKNTKLAEDTVYLCRSLGFKTTISKENKSCPYKGEIKTGEYNRIYINGKGLKDIPVLLERKKATSEPTKELLNTTIKIIPLGIDQYYGFEIDGNHRFLLGDFTVTHNTALALKILKNTSDAGVISVFASLDMRRNRIFEKLLYRVSGLSRQELYSAIQNDTKLAKKIFGDVKEQYKNVFFYDRSSPTVEDIRDYIGQVELATGQKVKLVMLDYFERVNADKSDDTAASKEVAGKLQDLVNDLNVCLVTLVQPNKFALSAGPDTPILNYTSIKGSGYLYQSFRSIISIWRPFFTPETKDNDKFLEMAVLKNDLGELGKFQFGWSGKQGEIWSLTDEEKSYMNELIQEKNRKKSQESSDNNGWN